MCWEVWRKQLKGGNRHSTLNIITLYLILEYSSLRLVLLRRLVPVSSPIMKIQSSATHTNSHYWCLSELKTDGDS